MCCKPNGCLIKCRDNYRNTAETRVHLGINKFPTKQVHLSHAGLHHKSTATPTRPFPKQPALETWKHPVKSLPGQVKWISKRSQNVSKPTKFYRIQQICNTGALNLLLVAS